VWLCIPAKTQPVSLPILDEVTLTFQLFRATRQSPQTNSTITKPEDYHLLRHGHGKKLVAKKT
jgi:hypothetical protein